jgi:hypothetical protein
MKSSIFPVVYVSFDVCNVLVLYGTRLCSLKLKWTRSFMCRLSDQELEEPSPNRLDILFVKQQLVTLKGWNDLKTESENLTKVLVLRKISLFLCFTTTSYMHLLSHHAHSGRSGLPKISGWVIQVLKIAIWKHNQNFGYPTFRVPDISGSIFRLPELPKITTTIQYYNAFHNSWQ